MNRYLRATLALAVFTAIIGAILGYAIYYLLIFYLHAAYPDAVILDRGIGPIHGWYAIWFVAAAAGFFVGLPKTLYKVHKLGPGPSPGGVMVARDVADDKEYMRRVAGWLDEHVAMVRVAAPGDRMHPPCLRCGREVEAFRMKPGGWVVVRFRPCGCRVALSRRYGGRAGAGGVKR